MNGDWSTIFPTAIDLLVQYIRQLTGSSDDTSNINTIRRHIVNRQNEIVAVDWTNNKPSDGHNYQYDWETVIYYEKHS